MTLLATREANRKKGFEFLRRVAYSDRVGTPQKNAVLALSVSSNTRRGLGKEQRLLQDLTRKCRIQEVNDLSSEMTHKIRLSSGNKDPHAHLNTLTSSQETFQLDETSTARSDVSSPEGKMLPRPMIERTYTMFPNRRARKTQNRDLGSISLPRLQISYRKGVMPSQGYYRTTLLAGSKVAINGPIQMDHYHTTHFEHLSPSFLPSIRYVGMTDTDNVDLYVRAQGVRLKTNTRLESLMLSRGYLSPRLAPSALSYYHQTP